MGSSLNAAEAKRPNILFVFADDWGSYASAYAKRDGSGTINDVDPNQANPQILLSSPDAIEIQ